MAGFLLFDRQVAITLTSFLCQLILQMQHDLRGNAIGIK